MTPLPPPRYVVTRNEDHTYVMQPEGRLMPGVTTIMKARANPAIPAWMVADLCERLGVKKSSDKRIGWKHAIYVGGLWEPGVSYRSEQIAAIVNEARKGAGKKSDKAKDVGTDAHSWIEECIRSDMKESEGHPVDYPPMPADPESACSAESWLAWREAHEVTWLAAETFVGSRDYWYGGTYDALGLVKGPCTNGVLAECMIDWKTSGGIYDDIWLQLTALLKAHVEMTGDATPYRRVGARVPKDGKPLEWVEAPAWASLDLCFRAFTGLLEAHRFNQASEAAREGRRS